MRSVYSISEVNLLIKSTLNVVPELKRIQVKGEISNFKRYASGHCYFTLKDENSVLKSVMFRSRASLLRFKPENGHMVIASGRIEVYERDGVYQIYVDNLFPDGLGDLMLAYEQLKQKLSSEGLFSEDNKQSLPFLPNTVGIITSPSGAVLHDIITVSKKRNPSVGLLFYPVRVQGVEAPLEIVNAIEKMNQLGKADVLIVGRGGGSLEELWAFNDERVVGAIAKSKIPIVSAVGHETDFTLADFVADIRAATPSQAAELAVPDRQMLLDTILYKKQRIKQLIAMRLDNLSLRLNHCLENRIFRQPENLFVNKVQHLDALQEQLKNSMQKNLTYKEKHLALLAGKLNALSPLAILSRGYSIASTMEDKVIKSIKSLQKGDIIQTRFKDGTVYSSVDKLYLKGENDG